VPDATRRFCTRLQVGAYEFGGLGFLTGLTADSTGRRRPPRRNPRSDVDGPFASIRPLDPLCLPFFALEPARPNSSLEFADDELLKLERQGV